MRPDETNPVQSYRRSPEDLLRVIVFAAATVGVVLITKFMTDMVAGLQQSVVNLVSARSEDLLRILEGILNLATLAAGLLTLLVPLLTRRFRLFAYVLAADVLCAVLMGGIDTWFGNAGGVTNAYAVAAGVSQGPLPDATSIAQTAAAFVVFSPFVSRRWRRMLWWLFALILVLQMVVSIHPPASTAIAVVLGPMVGSAMLLVFGRPNTRATPDSIMAALRAGGLPAQSIEPAAVDARGSTPYFARMQDGSRLFVKVLGADERAADLLFRMYRRLRLKNIGDERPDSSLRRTVEHEALASLQARDVGVSTPRMRSVAGVGDDSFLLAYDLIAGRSLDALDAERLSDDVLGSIWAQVGVMHEHRIAHRDLRLANVFLDDDDRPWIIDFGFAEIAAADDLLRADVAELMASLATVLGTQRAAGTAVNSMGPTTVGGCVGRLQPVALSGATRTALKAQPGLLDELRGEVVERCAVEEPRIDPLTRFKPSHGVILTAIAAVLYLGIPTLLGWGDVAATLGNANWGSTGWLLASVAAAEAALTAVFVLSSPVAVPVVSAGAAVLASVFASTTAPALLGSTSLRVRFLERHGVPADSAEASTALASAGTAVTYLALLVAFLFWAGKDAFDSFDVDHPSALWIATGALATMGVVLLILPASRAWLRCAVTKKATLTRGALGALSVQPVRLVAMVVAAGIAALGQVAALSVAGSIMGINLTIATVGTVYLLASIAASAVPTPAHLGAIELLLLAGLLALGVRAEPAAITVLVYRLAAFWLPLVLGRLGFGWLRRNDHV